MSISATLLDDVRTRGPLIQCITNAVTTNFVANALLATGAAPAMTDVVGEAGLFAAAADGLLINLGTAQPQERDAMREAVAAANTAGTPWTLDPVAVGSLPIRTDLAAELLASGPTAIRGNASEILALAGVGAGGKGVETVHTVHDAQQAATTLARDLGTVVAVSGAHDIITDGEHSIQVSNGHELLTNITGGGCALGALVTAFLAVADNYSPLEATATAHVVYGIAAQQAGRISTGPGTFIPQLLDALFHLTSADVTANAQVGAV